MHSFSISQPIDGTCSLLLLSETKSVVFFFFWHSWNAIEEEAITLSVYYHYVFRCCCCSFYPSLCRLSRFLLSYVAVSGSCRLSEFYLKRAFFIPYLPLMKNSQPVCPDDFMGPKILINTN